MRNKLMVDKFNPGISRMIFGYADEDDMVKKAMEISDNKAAF